MAIDPSVRMAAIDRLAKLMGLYSDDKININLGNQPVVIDPNEAAVQLRAMRKALEQGDEAEIIQ